SSIAHHDRGTAPEDRQRIACVVGGVPPCAQDLHVRLVAVNHVHSTVALVDDGADLHQQLVHAHALLDVHRGPVADDYPSVGPCRMILRVLPNGAIETLPSLLSVPVAGHVFACAEVVLVLREHALPGG